MTQITVIIIKQAQVIQFSATPEMGEALLLGWIQGQQVSDFKYIHIIADSELLPSSELVALGSTAIVQLFQEFES